MNPQSAKILARAATQLAVTEPLKAMREERDRYREALVRIVKYPPTPWIEHEQPFLALQAIAAAALDP